MRGLLKKFRDGFKRQTPTLHRAFEGLFTGARLDREALDRLEEALFTADFGVETAEEILAEVEAAHKEDKTLRGEDAARIAAEVLTRALEGAEGRLAPGVRKPEVICLVGVNGAGKTTTAAKLGHLYQNEGYGVLLGACDTFRAAANEQIRTWSERLGIDLVASQHGADAAAVAFDSHAAAASRGSDLLILDTAGRLHTKDNLMKELGKLRRVLAKQDPSAPHHSWLVVDGSLGSNSIEQARAFHETFPLTGLVVTKLDGTSRGGALVAIYRELKLPIYFVGLGERPGDLQPFSARDYAEAIFGVAEEEEAAR